MKPRILLLFILFAHCVLLQAQDSTILKQQPALSRDSIPQISPPAALSREAQTVKLVEPEKKTTAPVDWATALAALAAVAGFLFGLYQYRMRKRDKKQEKLAELQAQEEFEQGKRQQQARTAEEQYRDKLKEELGSIKMLGSPEIENLPVNVNDAFVHLDISETWRTDSRFDPEKPARMESGERLFPPDKTMQRAFEQHRVLLIIGDPGSGKTTLMQYYAMCCLDGKSHGRLGFAQPVLPMYFPLRELDAQKSLAENLHAWAQTHMLEISVQDFNGWLRDLDTLVLLDGLDEISEVSKRREACAWIDKAGVKRAKFVVTSRWTGYRKQEGIELGCEHLRADVRDLTEDQQKDFLDKWFRAVYLRETPDEQKSPEAWRQQQLQQAQKSAANVIEFLRKRKNKSLRELAAVPMLLQIIAIIWKTRENIPKGRAALYAAALNYLLEYRDAPRRLPPPVLPADKAHRVLAPAALWLQERRTDEVARQDLHAQMQPILDTMDERPQAENFCANLRDRAGVLVDYGKQDYLFRHKSFREFFAAEQLVKECRTPKAMAKLAANFNKDWWEETLRFFMALSDDKLFDDFMRALFKAPFSRELDQRGQNLLMALVQEAPQKRLNALAACLRDHRVHPNRHRYALECLKTIASPEAQKIVAEYLERTLVEKQRQHEAKIGARGAEIPAMEPSGNLSFAQEILAEARAPGPPQIITPAPAVLELFQTLPKFFRNSLEDNAEYILIPGGKFKYSVTGKIEPVPDIYFAKYPVTNKRYRRFIAYLAGENPAEGQAAEGRVELEQILPRQKFAEALRTFADSIKEYRNYLGNDFSVWPDKLRSNEDSNKRFNQDDQPVVSISWFAARAYCFWLSELQKANGKEQKEISVFRLPTETEWEWAAAGREADGTLREYPWPKAKGDEPSDKLANYGGNVGATTPVGRYSEGATLEGLHDMAGNVWEWMENWYDKDQEERALRGGSWDNDPLGLRCAARLNNHPFDLWNDLGIRVVCAQSSFDSLKI